MNGTKPWWASKTIWVGIAGVLSGVAQEAGIEMSAKEVATLGENLSSLAAVVLGLLTIWTRKKADKRIE